MVLHPKIRLSKVTDRRECHQSTNLLTLISLYEDNPSRGGRAVALGHKAHTDTLSGFEYSVIVHVVEDVVPLSQFGGCGVPDLRRLTGCGYCKY